MDTVASMLADIRKAALDLTYLEAMAVGAAERGDATPGVLEALCRIWLRIPR